MGEKVEYMQYEGGSVKVYTGPKGGKYVVNKKGKKVYLDKKTLNSNITYKKKTKKR